MDMCLALFIKGSKALPMLLGEERLQDIEVALTGGSLMGGEGSKDFIDNVQEKYVNLTRTPRERKEKIELSRLKEKWDTRDKGTVPLGG